MVQGDAEFLARVFERLPRRLERVLFETLTEVFRRDAKRWEGAMVRSLSGPLVLDGVKSSSEALASRRGSAGLRGSFGSTISGSTLERLEQRKFTTARHGRVHELGTASKGGELPDITPRSGQFLAIPLRDAMTPSGVPRRQSARDWPDTFVMPSTTPEGNTAAFIVQDAGDGELTFLYRLARRSSMPPRLGMRDTHRAQSAERAKDFRRAFQTALGRTRGR